MKYWPFNQLCRSSRRVPLSCDSLSNAACVEALEQRLVMTTVPLLESLPDAPVTLFLDFDGGIIQHPDWNLGSPLAQPAYDTNGDTSSFSPDELQDIEEIWYRVAEDWLPLNINVTTEEPDAIQNFESVQVAIGGDGAWTGSISGGSAFVDGFSTSRSNTGFVFSENLFTPKQIALNVSHEAAHLFGLQHHSLYDEEGNKIEEYDPGSSEVGPLMGAAFSSLRDTWANSPGRFSADVFQDDLLVMTRAANQVVEFRADDHSDLSDVSATALAVEVVDGVTNLSGHGIIGVSDDIDVFRFTTEGGNLQVNVSGLDLRNLFSTSNPGTNLDVVLEIRDAAGDVHATIDDASLSASFDGEISAGDWFLVVGNNGEYGSLGQYEVSATVTANTTPLVLTSPTGTINTRTPVFTWQAEADAVVELQVDRSGTTVFQESGLTGSTFSTTTLFDEGFHLVRLRETDGEWTDWSEFTIDVPTPLAPSLLTESGSVNAARPEIEWTATDFAQTWTLWIQDADSLATFYFQSGLNSTTHTPTTELPEGSYFVRARAENEVGELSVWSEPITLEVDLPATGSTSVLGPVGVARTNLPTITWSAAEGASNYTLWLNHQTSGVARYLFRTGINGTSFTPTEPIEEGVYRVWVLPVNDRGEPGAWSQGFSFEVEIPIPQSPQILSPVYGASEATGTPLIEWTAVEHAAEYEIVATPVNEFVKVIETVVPGTNLLPASSLDDGEYIVSVRARNAAGELSLWSHPRRFTVAAAPENGALPESSAFQQNPDVELHLSFRAARFFVRVSARSLFSDEERDAFFSAGSSINEI